LKRTFFALVLPLLFATSVHASCTDAASDTLISALIRQAPGLSAKVLRLALDASRCAAARGLVTRRDLLTVIDYSMASSKPRLFVFDIAAKKLLFRELVAHGKNSGGDVASSFSNDGGSLQSSIGLFVTAGTYNGGNGYSLRLRGLEEGYNDLAWDRLIVMHGASYVSQEAIRVLGRLGRSWGCPAVRSEIAKKIIDTVRDGSAIFAYYPDPQWLAKSEYVAREVQSSAAIAAR
jgi:hypothetical protein